MTLTEHVKILDDKIRANKAQYDRDRQAAKIYALSSGELEKYEYLTGENLGYKPDVVQKAKFEYSPLGQVFNKGLDTSDKKEGLLKKLKNIEGKNEQQLEAIRNQGERQLEAIRDFSVTSSPKEIKFSGEENEEQKALINEIKVIDRKSSSKSFAMVHPNKKLYDFNMFKSLGQFASHIYNNFITIKDAKEEQDELVSKIRDLTEYIVRIQERVKQKQKILKNVKQLFETRDKIIDSFQNGVFPAPKNVQEKQIEEEEKQTIPGWVLVSDYNVNKMKEEIDDSVVNNLGPKVNGEKIAYVHL